MPFIFIDRFLSSITMYRLVLYGLLLLAGIAILFGFFGLLPYSGFQFIVTLVIVVLSSFITNMVCARILKVPTNSESWFITTVILFFLLAPVTNLQDGLIAMAAGSIAMLSKYVLAIERKHIFNPAAVAIFLLGLFGFGNGIWWVGSAILLPFVAVIGLLVVRKVRRFHLLVTFLVTAVITLVFFNGLHGMSVQESVLLAFTSWPLIFFGTIMLTEPLTLPPRKQLQMFYGGVVGLFFGAQFHIGPLFASPELALLIGNMLSYIVSPKQRLMLHLKTVREIGVRIHEVVFTKPRSFTFLPGQYLEWTMPHVPFDNRGNRRYFTIASAPTEEDIKLGVKVTDMHPSTFKQKLLSLKKDALVVSSQLAGDFIMPEDPTKKLVFIAGGIGVTPFRSMIQYLLDIQQKRDIILFYTAASKGEFVYKDIFAAAEKMFGIQTVYVITNLEQVPTEWTGEAGRLTSDMITKYVKSPQTYTFYLSGPNAMVESYKKLIQGFGVQSKNIKTDYFPGF